MQSGKAGLNHWRIDFDTLAGSGRWINPLMGWASTADYMQGTSLKFATELEAVRFCEKQGESVGELFESSSHLGRVSPC